MTHPYLDWPGPLAFAHRGGASDNPENTMPAFQHAVDLGYTYLETDVHATTDGVLMVFHDNDLERTCGRPGRIDELPFSEVSQARVDGTEPIPTFDDFMEAFPDMVVRMDSATGENNRATFHWTWTGTNTGPGGTGRSVRISGYEEWTFSADGLIAQSSGHYDEAEYQRQMSDPSGEP